MDPKKSSDAVSEIGLEDDANFAEKYSDIVTKVDYERVKQFVILAELIAIGSIILYQRSEKK